MRWRVGLVLGLVLVFASLTVLGATPISVPQVQVVKELKHDLSPPLREMIPPPDYKFLSKHEDCNPPEKREHEGVVQSWEDPVVQRQARTEAMPAITSWEGLSAAQSGGYFPPDTEGDVGLNHYVQWVNVYMQIWDKSGTSVWGPHPGNYIWNGFGGPCDSCNDGDPIVLYDRLSDRWIISQFALPNYPSGPFYQYIAVSQTGDPTGSWYRYAFTVHATKMNDYPKFGVWPDGYYMTAHLFGSGGMGVYVFEKSKMLTGQAATMQYFDLEGTKPFWGMLPGTYEGTIAPPAGAPCPFAEVDDSSDIGPSDAMRIWNFHVDWTTPANTTFGLAGDPNWVLPVAAFTPFCTSGQCVPQPGTAQNLDDLADRLMYKLVYRNFGDHQAMVLNHTVDAGSGRAGVRWYEVRNDGTDWSIFQQGTFAPADTEYRWMGSIGFDHVGNIAMGYSVSSSTVYPSIRVAGRLASDPAGTMGQGEGSMMVGSGSQTGSDSYGRGRWGDYSTISADPSDDCTFWYTTEYMQTTSGAGWQTRVGSFKFPNCSVGPQGTLSGTVTAQSGGAPIAGATVTADNGTISLSTITGPAGTYSLALPITPPTYSVTASAFGYNPANVTGVAITTGATTTQNFALTGATSYTVSGTVTDANTGWGLYADVNITASGWPGTTIQTNPTTGAYSINLVAGATYSFTVNSIVSGYSTGTATVGPLAGPATQNFPLAVNACSAPGYGVPPVLTENWDSVTPPAIPSGWAVDVVSGTGNWLTNAGTRYPSGGGTVSAPNVVYFNSFSASTGAQARLKRTSGMDLTGMTSPAVKFYMFHDSGYGTSNDTVQVQVSTDGGTTWQPVGSAISRNVGTGWVKHTVALTGFTGPITSVLVAFLGTSAYGNDCHLDDVAVGDDVCNAPPGGLIVGFVKDASTTNPIAGASVVNATTAFTGSSNAQGFYAVYAAAGANALTASKATYQNGTANPTGVAHVTVQQDFNLSTSAQYTLSGTVTDATTGWPLYATLVFSASGVPTQTAYTNPVTGAYSATIYSGMVYTVAGTAWPAGYTALATTVGPIAGDTTQDFTMTAAGSCTAPGYSAPTLLTENFDGVTPPTLPPGWATYTTATVNWTVNAGRTHPSGTAHSAPNTARFNSYSYSSGSARLYRTSGLNLTGVASPSVSFWMYHDTGYTSNDRIQFQVSTDGTTWQNVGAVIPRYIAGVNAWQQHVIPLTGFTGPITNVLIGFYATTAYGNDCYIDDVLVQGQCSPPAGGGLIVGNVYDANTSAALNGATVNDTTSGKSALTAATVDPSLDDGFYCLYGTEGANSMNASATGYGTDNQTPTVPHYGAVRQDFHLAVGRLTATPTSLSITLAPGQTGQQTFDLTNIGGASADFSLMEISGHVASPKLDPLALKRDAGVSAKRHMPTAPGKDKEQVPPSAEARPSKGDATTPFGPPEFIPPANVPAAPVYGIRLYPTKAMITFNTTTPGTVTTIGGTITPSYYAGGFVGGDFSKLYVIDSATNMLRTIDTTTGAATDVITMTAPIVGTNYSGFTATNGGLVYLCSTTVSASELYTANLTTGAVTPIGPVTNAAGLIDIAVNAAGEIYGVDIVLDNLVKIDPATGAGTIIGPLGYDAQYAQDVEFDMVNNILYWAATNDTSGEWRTIDTATGASTLIGAIETDDEVDALGIGTYLSPDVPWLDENPKSGTIAAGSAQTITVDYDTAGLTPGDYLATIRANNTTPYGPVNVPVTLTVACPTITLAPAVLPNPQPGVPYSQQLTVTGTSDPCTFAVTSGALPPGLTLSSDGLLSGTPPAGGSYTFTVTATLTGTPCTGSQSYTLSLCPTITLAPSTLPNGSVGAFYTKTITAAGGTAPYTFAVTAGTLPTGLTLSAAGLLSGTPTVGGSYTFTVTSTDVNTCTASQQYTVVASAYDMSYVDDMGRSRVCANSKTGNWQYTVLSAAGKGTYTGKGSVTKTADRIVIRSAAGSPRLMLLTYYIDMYRATASLTDTAWVSQLSDKNTKDDPPGCTGY